MQTPERREMAWNGADGRLRMIMVRKNYVLLTTSCTDSPTLVDIGCLTGSLGCHCDRILSDNCIPAWVSKILKQLCSMERDYLGTFCEFV